PVQGTLFGDRSAGDDRGQAGRRVARSSRSGVRLRGGAGATGSRAPKGGAGDGGDRRDAMWSSPPGAQSHLPSPAARTRRGSRDRDRGQTHSLEGVSMETVKYEFILEAAEPVAHHAESIGNEAILMRKKVRQ